MDSLRASYDVFWCLTWTLFLVPCFTQTRWCPYLHFWIFFGNIRHWKRDTSGRVVSLLFKLDDLRIKLINIYAPTNLVEKKVFFRNLYEYFLSPDVLIIAGDYNCYDHNLDKFGGNFVPAKCLTDFRSAFSLRTSCLLLFLVKSALVFFSTMILFVFPSSPMGITPVVLAKGSLLRACSFYPDY